MRTDAADAPDANRERIRLRIPSQKPSTFGWRFPLPHAFAKPLMG
jgi:hypothetical protein